MSVSINRITKQEQVNNAKLLSTFQFVFSANDFTNLKELLHPHGRFFGKMNREKVCGYFYSIFFGINGTSEKYHVQGLHGISLDASPGETVLELRCSEFDPFRDDCSLLEKNFGEKPDSRINESIHRFAFTFRDGKIFTIRIPKKCTADIEYLTQNN